MTDTIIKDVRMEAAMQALSCAMDERTGLDAFCASTVLAIMFDMDKETALDKFIEYRAGA